MVDQKVVDPAAEAKMRADMAEEKKKKDHEEFNKMRADQAKMNEEVMAKQAKSRPTPSIEEVHRAMTGGGLDNKEPDGSPEQDIYHHTVPPQTQIEKTSEAKPGDNKAGYVTRDMAAKPVVAPASAPAPAAPVAPVAPEVKKV
jgi:hypothetical protein